MLARLKAANAAPPTVGIILGTGLRDFANALEGAVVVPYASIPHFPQSTVESHAGELHIGTLGGQRVFLAPVGGEEDNKMSDDNLGVAKDTLDARLKARIPVKAGRRKVAVTFLPLACTGASIDAGLLGSQRASDCPASGNWRIRLPVAA